MAAMTRANPSILGAQQYPSQSGKFIPELWSGKLQVKFYKSTVFGEIANTDYEGEIRKHGEKVQIRTVPTITIRNYEVGAVLTNEVPTSNNVLLEINKGKYFSFLCDDVEKTQADVGMIDKFSGDAAEQMKISIDTDVLSSIYVDAATANKGGTAGAISGSINLGTTGAALQVTTSNVLDFIINMGLVLDEQNVPETGRWLVLPAWACALIKRSDLKDASVAGDSMSIMRNGRLGMIDRFTIYMSNNLHTVSDGGTCFYTYAGTKDAVTFASQLVKMETLRAQTTFGEIVRGLNVYGYKVVKPEALSVGYIKR